MNLVVRRYVRAPQTLNDPGNAAQDYRKEAEKGHTITAVHAATPGEVASITEFLLSYSAHQVRHLGTRVQTDVARSCVTPSSV